MSSILRIIGAGVLLSGGLAAGLMADFILNDGRVLYALVDRAGLEQACLPELKKGLAVRGFAPNDVEFGPRPSIGVAFGRNESFSADFSFQDGAEQTRVDGIMACVVGRKDIHVDFRTRARPVRAA